MQPALERLCPENDVNRDGIGPPVLADAQCVFQLPFGHSRASLNPPSFGFVIKLMTGMSVGPVGARYRGAASSGRFSRVAARHRPGALAVTISADMCFALALLLGGPPVGFYFPGSAKVAAIAFRPVVF
jgi:hypothetical protein